MSQDPDTPPDATPPDTTPLVDPPLPIDYPTIGIEKDFRGDEPLPEFLAQENGPESGADDDMAQ
jgi:hypothetical protein